MQPTGFLHSWKFNAYGKRRTIYAAFSALWVMAYAGSAFAQAVNLPSSADPSRVRPEEQATELPEDATMPARPQGALPSMPIPEGADKIRFVLCEVRIEGATVFTQEDLKSVYVDRIGQEISLDEAYKLAGEITNYYRDEGYFLSLALIPDQQIQTGIVTIKVVEGYVGDVRIEKPEGDNRVLQQYISQLLEKRPLKADEMESFLLRINDLPGQRYSGILEPADHVEPGAVTLALVSEEKSGSGMFGFDNLSSRYLGPHQMFTSYSTSLLPLQQTSFFGLTSAPLDRLNYASLSHSIVLAPDLTLDFSASTSRGRPKYHLAALDIKSDSQFLGATLNYQWIRQRQKNFSLRLGLDGRNTNSDILSSAPLTRDRIRAVRAGATFDGYDSWRGYSALTLTFSKGIRAFDASEAGELTLSRFEAKPDFSKAEFSLTRLQGLYGDWSGVFMAAGQIASGPLFSAEEFGYGGSSFGRAYDLSEITGDHGINAAAELRYGGWRDYPALGFIPYAFYDFGIVWNDDMAQVARASGTSAGFGVRTYSQSGINSNLTVAFPLTRDVSAPLYGQNESAPRFLFQVSRSF